MAAVDPEVARQVISGASWHTHERQSVISCYLSYNRLRAVATSHTQGVRTPGNGGFGERP